MPIKKASLDEIVSKRRASADDDGKLYKAVILGEEKGFNSQTRSQRFTMSSESVDRYGDIVRQDGINIDQFLKNPVGLAFHQHGRPIGWWTDVKKINGRPKRTEGTLNLHPEGTTDTVDEIARLLGAAAIKACSIGFMPLEAEWILDDEGRNTYGLDFLASELLEVSICSVPANPDSLSKAANGDMRLAAELFERFLDTYCEKTAGGLLVRKEFEDAYTAIKAADKTKDKNADKTVTVKLELDSAEVVEELDGIFARFQKKFADLFASSPEPKERKIPDPFEAYHQDRLAVTQHTEENGEKWLSVEKWPEKFVAYKEFLEDMATEHGCVTDDSVTFRVRDAIAQYKIAGRNDDYGHIYLDLIEIKAIEPAPVLVPNSRAKAKAKTADLMARLRMQGLVK